jgi:hypothetical protein
MKTSKEHYQELVQEPFWETKENPITGYVVPSRANFSAREQEIINRRAERERTEKRPEL